MHVPFDPEILLLSIAQGNSHVNTGIKTFRTVLFVMAKQSRLSVGKWFYVDKIVMQWKCYYKSFYIKMGESHRHNDHQKEKGKKKKVAEVFILYKIIDI